MSKFLVLLLTLSFQLIAYIPQISSECIWYGEALEIDGKIKNTPYNGKALPLQETELLQTFQKRCPLLYNEYKSDDPEAPLELCCDANQIRSMFAGMSQTDNVYGSCPTCQSNLLSTICVMTCAKNQSNFLTPYENTNNGVDYIEAVDYKIDKTSAENIFKSCQGVQFSQAGLTVMDLACGTYNSRSCNYQRWFNFMGDASGIYVPFPINYKFLDATEATDKEHMIFFPKKCNEAYEGQYACSCIDCSDNCPSDIGAFEQETRFEIVGLYGPTFIAAMVLGALIILLIFCGFCNILKSPKRMPTLLTGLTDLNLYMYKAFKYWGIFCAKNPVLILAICSWVFIFLAYGVKYLQVTTDPVKVWAGEQSSTRLNKQYNDEHFVPFYRTNQIFIKPKNTSMVSKDYKMRHNQPIL